MTHKMVDATLSRSNLVCVEERQACLDLRTAAAGVIVHLVHVVGRR
ncbi:MAG: hypothetical protein Q8M31_15135 [Beijerinckiaceae bacterium]|nr:hypothetical protein [Beijerinckiaceae bacterium]